MDCFRLNLKLSFSAELLGKNYAQYRTVPLFKPCVSSRDTKDCWFMVVSQDVHDLKKIHKIAVYLTSPIFHSFFFSN